VGQRDLKVRLGHKALRDRRERRVIKVLLGRRELPARRVRKVLRAHRDHKARKAHPYRLGLAA